MTVSAQMGRFSSLFKLTVTIFQRKNETAPVTNTILKGIFYIHSVLFERIFKNNTNVNLPAGCKLCGNSAEVQTITKITLLCWLSSSTKLFDCPRKC